MEKWKKILNSCISDSATLSKYLDINKEEADEVIAKYPMRINTYYLSLIKGKGDPIWKQCVPDALEIKVQTGKRDPLLEKNHSPFDGLVHRYKDRVLLIVSDMCAGYCRFCTRKRMLGTRENVLQEKIFLKALQYIKQHKEIRDVVISGGDPLVLDDNKLEHYIKNIKKIKHVEIIRIDSRTPCFLPQRITPQLCEMLKKYSPIYLNTHFNHFQEITRESRKACKMLAESGIVLGNQTVLLAGVNDNAETLKKLFEGLLTMCVRPYYMYIPDAVKGTYHFRVSIAKAVRIMKKLIGHTSGLAIPHLVIDLKYGGGKTPLLPNYIIKHKGKRYTFKNFENEKFYYADIS